MSEPSPEAVKPLAERAPLPSGARWVLPAVFAGLLILGVVSGAEAMRILNAMHTGELTARRAISERTQTLSGMWLTIQIYDEAIQRYVSAPAGEVDAPTLERIRAAIAQGLTGPIVDVGDEDGRVLIAME